MIQRPTIGIVEIPDLGLIDSSGKDWLTHNSKGSILISKKVLLSNLRGAGFDAQLIDLENGGY